MVRQSPWDEYEASILLEAVIQIYSGKIDRKQAIADVSEKLRRKARRAGLEIDDTYRNIAGITFQMHSMESAYVGYTLVKPATKLFLEIVKTMKERPEEYNAILQEANRLIGTKDSFEDKYLEWLLKKVSAAQMSELYITYTQISDYFIEQKVLKRPLLETTDMEVLSAIVKTVNGNKMFRFKYKRQINKMTSAIRYYIKFLKEERETVGETKIEIEVDEAVQNENQNIDETLKEGVVSEAEQRKKKFTDWMLNNDMEPTTARQFNSSIETVVEIARTNRVMSMDAFEISDVDILKDTLAKLMKVPEFIEKNEKQHNQLRVAWVKYIQFSGDPSFDFKMLCSESDEEERIKSNNSILYRRLKSMASVYDDIDGFEIEWIRSKLGLAIGVDELREFLDEIPWITEVKEGVYSFSKESECIIDFDKEAFVKVLMLRYQNGMQIDSIDLDNFRETYNEIIEEEINLSDKELEKCLRKCGVWYKGRIFPAEGIISDAARDKLLDYIKNSFESGKKVLYYKAIFSDLSDVFMYCFNLYDAMMLRPYLEYVCSPGEFYFGDEYISKEQDVEINLSAEIEDYMLSAGKPLSYEEIYAGLSHVSKEVIYNEIKTNPNIILSEREHYYHYGIFEFSSEDADVISEYISNDIIEDGYCIWSHVYRKIQQTMPLFIENNIYLLSLGIRNAVAKKLSGRFSFDGEVISNCGQSLNMAAVYRLYGEHHAPFFDNDIYEFSKEVNGGVIYFDSLSESVVRVSKELFVAKEKITFDIRATDNALSTYLSSGYMPIKEFDSFLIFPNVGYEWNTFLLESYLMYYSSKYALANNGRSLSNVAGAVVKKGSGYDDFEDICADVLAKSDCTLTKNKALDYLAEMNLLTRRSYNKIDDAIAKAKQIRNKKG